MSEKVGWRLRKQGLQAKTVSLKVRFYNFKTVTRAQTTTGAFNDDDTIFKLALHLLENISLKPVRLLGVTVSNFSLGEQLSLFDAKDKAGGKLDAVLDKINRRYAPGTITKGRTLPTNPE